MYKYLHTKQQITAIIFACTAFGLLCVFPGVFFHFRVIGARPVTTGLVMRVNVRPTTDQQQPAA